MMRIRQAVAAVTLLIVLSAMGYAIAKKEAILERGRTILLPTAPADPRSLMQGDYMRLGYALTLFPDAEAIKTLPYKGHVVLTLDDKATASFARLDDGTPLGDGEIRVLYRRTSTGWGRRGMKYAPDSYFFEEGQGPRFEGARFVMVTVGESGETVLVGLADENGIRIPNQTPVGPQADKPD